MFLEDLNAIISRVAETYSSDEILDIKKEYQKLGGSIFDDDRSYEARMACFLEWFVLEKINPVSTETAIEKFIRINREDFSAEQLKIYKDFTESIHGIFIIKKITSDTVAVLNLLNDEKYRIHVDGGDNMFQKNDIFEGRIISHFDKIHFTGSFCFHPPKATKFIKSEIKQLRQKQKKIYDELAKLNRNLKSLEIDIKSVSSDITKLNAKIAKTSSENKRLSLGEKLKTMENNLSTIMDEQTMMKVRTATWEKKEIKIGCSDQCFQLIQKLSYMSLKLERSRQIDVKDIYKN